MILKNIHLFILLSFLFISNGGCVLFKNNSAYKLKQEQFGMKQSSLLAIDGITSYLIVPLNKRKYAISTNYALCGVILKGRFDGKECFDAINQFYTSKKTLAMTDISDAFNFDVIDFELLKVYTSKGAIFLMNEMYDNNCIPIYKGNLSHSSVKAAALITMGINLVQTQYNEYELSTASCDFYHNHDN